MEYITLKNSDLRVSRLCVGGCPMGGHGWGVVQENELIDAVHAALDQGINFFDNADTYGLGQSERTLGKALGSRRSEAVIATKFGVRVTKQGTVYDNSPQWIREACESSLQRLGADYIDLYQMHYRDGRTSIGTVLEVLEQLRQEGKIRYFGLSNLTQADFAELSRYKCKFVSLQNEYSLARRDHEADMLQFSRELDLTPLTWGSLGQGILTGKYDRTAAFGSDDRRSREIYVNFHGEKLLKNLEIVERMRPIAAEHGKSVSAVAIRFILDHLKDSVVICGVKRPAQLLGNAESLGWHLSPEELDLLDRISR
ncbi:MAG: aldo/keto reductase [Oscillospiraceae bacterium]|nr:aldo/keto reductase [Oscillospiraceae bacterium]